MNDFPVCWQDSDSHLNFVVVNISFNSLIYDKNFIFRSKIHFRTQNKAQTSRKAYLEFSMKKYRLKFEFIHCNNLSLYRNYAQILIWYGK